MRILFFIFLIAYLHTESYGQQITFQKLNQDILIRSIKPYTRGGYIMPGEGISQGGAMFCKTDKYGKPLVVKLYGNNSNEFVSDIYEAPDGGFVMAGVCSHNQNLADCIIKLDSMGDVLWRRIITNMFGQY